MMKRILRAVLPPALVLSLALLLVPAARAANVSVSIGDNFYDPATITVSAGDTVTWTNNGQQPHTVTATDGSFDSSPGCPGDVGACMGPGETYSRTFQSAGTIEYFCTVHGQSMSGTVVVEGGDGPGPTGTGLPGTGGGNAQLPLAILGIALLVGGGTALFLLRRRRA